MTELSEFENDLIAMVGFIRNNYAAAAVKILKKGYDPCSDDFSVEGYPSLLHLAVHCRNIVILPELLKHTDSKNLTIALRTPFNGYDSPLHYAISRLDIRCAEILLKAGSDPNLIVGSGITPLCAIPTLVDNSNTDVSPQYQMMSLLMLYGADPDLPSRSKETPLHFLCHLACCSPDAAILLLERSSSASYAQQGFKDLPPFAQTPLAVCLRSLCGIVSGPALTGSTLSDSYLSRMRKMWNYAILPLLRNGADVQPDLLRSSFDLVRIALSYSTIGEILWNDRDKFLQLLITTRKKSSISFRMLPVPIHSQYPGSLDRLKERIKALFPMKLQDICRIVIVDCLPPGHNTRHNSLLKLPIPLSLISYLSFSDFN